MLRYKYLIVGGGMAADAAVGGIREVDHNGSVAIIGAEQDPPYNRPPLSKGLWKGESLERIWRGTQDKGVEFHLGRRVQRIDPANKSVVDDQGTAYGFEKLLLATGGTPRRFSFGNDHIIYFRTIEDYRRLRTLSEGGRSFVVIGGGFIGTEVAAALTMNGKQVTMVFPEEGINFRLFPRELSLFLNGYYKGKGVEVCPEETVVGVEPRGGRIAVKIREVKTPNEREVLADGVVAGIGIQPNVELAQALNLKTGNGVFVDKFLRTSNPDIFAAGDVAAFHNPALGDRMRVEHEDNANAMGRFAGLNMAGKPEPYHHLPFFYSDLFDLGYEAVGEMDSRLQTIADWKEVNREGTIYYMRDGRVRGVLLWNVWEQVEAARRLIAEPGPFDTMKLKGRLPLAS